MSRTVKKLLSMLLCAALLFGSVAVGGSGLAEVLSAWSLRASAEEYGPFVYEINDGEVTILLCDYEVSGAVVIPDTIEGYPVTLVDDCVFNNCTGLTSVTFPASVTSIGCDLFFNCPALTEIIVSENNPNYSSDSHGVLFNKDQTTLIQYPIGNAAASYTVPGSVTHIEEYAFLNCTGLTSVTIPASVANIFYGAFSGCTALTDVYYTGTQQQWNAISIAANNDQLLNAALHVNYIPTVSGTCGTNLTWVYDPNTKTLTISGTGEMEPYSFETPAPWNAYADAIETVVIGDSVTSIGSHAFYNCRSITAITIPAGVTEIGDYPFLNCTALTDLTVAQDNAVFHSAGNCIIETAGKTLLYGCKNSVIPADGSVTSLGALAFYSCFGLTSLTIPDSVVSFSDSTFYNCVALTDLSIGNGITSIPASAFFGCGLTDVTIGSSVTTIGSNAFFGCSDLTNITIPVSVMSIGSYAFTYCADLANIYYDGTQQQWNAINIGDHNEPLQNATKHFTPSPTVSGTCGENLTWEYNPYTKTLTISGTGAMTDYSNSDQWVTTAPWGAYYDTMQTVVIESNVTSIGGYAFYFCPALTSVTIPDTVTSIGNYAFFGCVGLTDVTIPDSVTIICDEAFDACVGATSVTIGNGVTAIGSRAFHGCTMLTSLTVGNSVSYIGADAFDYCPTLSDVYFNGSRLSWNSITIDSNNDALRNATVHYSFFPSHSGSCGDNLAWVYDPDTLTLTISGTGAMTDYNSSLTDYPAVEPAVTTAPWGDYYDTIHTVVIESNVTSIGGHAFYFCPALTSVTIPDTVTSIGNYAFFGCTGLTNVTIPNSVASIGESAFSACITMTDVTIGSSVSVIGSHSFHGCTALTSITISDTITYIGDNAFAWCDHLADVYYGGTQQQWNAINIGADNEPLQNATKHFTLLPTVSGTCGTNLTWVYDPNTFTLTISGTGAMTDYSYSSLEESLVTTAPWKPYYNTMETVVINSGVSSIGDYAFYNCGAITGLTIGGDVASIGDNAFFGCDGLTDVTIPGNVKSIGSCAFFVCTGLTNLTLSDGVESLAFGAFSDCSSLTSVSLPNSVTSLGECAFNYCTMLTSATIGSGVTSIGECAFYGCANLTSLTIGDHVASIGDSAFYNCAGLTSITIPVSVTSIGEHAYYGCTDLSDVYYDGTQQQWNAINIGTDNNPLLNATKHFAPLPTVSGTCGENLTWVYDPNTFTLTISGTGAMTDYNVSDYNGNRVTTAPWCAYYDTMETVVINSGVSSIGAYAFYGCSTISSITIGGDVASIGDRAFCNCTGLTGATIPNNVTSIGDCAFFNCAMLTSVTIGSGVTSIGEGAFCNCTALTSVNIPDSVIAIGPSAFCNCDELTSVTIPDGAANIELIQTFEDCNKLTSVTIGNRVTSIGYYTFYNCLRLTNVTIPDSVTSIGYDAFGGCGGLTSITIPDNVASIDDYAFEECSGLTSVTVGTGVASIGYGSFYGCTDLSDVYYNGTQQQWNAINIGADNDPLLNATRHLHEHTFTANVTTPATCTEEGVMTYTCACGETYTETIPAKGHTLSEWIMETDPTPNSTGRMCQYCTECHILLHEMTVPMLSGTHVTGVKLSSSEEYLNMGETLTLTAEVTPATAANKTVLWTSSRPNVATVENGVVTPVAPGITVIIAQSEDSGDKDFCLVQVNAVTAQNGLVIDNGTIYGLSVNMSSLDEYLTLNDDTMILEISSDVIGTGTKITVKQGDTVVNEFEAVVFGDVDGNAWYDGTDAYFVKLVASGMISADALTDAQRMAADCNHDGAIDSADVALLEQAGLLLSSVDQTLPSEELQTNSVYLEYCSLIDQSIEITEPDQSAVTEEPTAEQGSASTVRQIILDLFKRLVNFVTMIFSIIVIPK